MLTIYFGDRESNNSVLSRKESKSKFSISWDYLTNTYYCLIIYDIDIVDCSVNLLAFNIQNNDVRNSDILIDYKIPGINKDLHTFVVDLYLQRNKITNFDQINELDLNNRYCSKAEDLVLLANLELVERTTFRVSS